MPCKGQNLGAEDWEGLGLYFGLNTLLISRSVTDKHLINSI